jgi:hypothetical protein
MKGGVQSPLQICFHCDDPHTKLVRDFSIVATPLRGKEDGQRQCLVFAQEVMAEETVPYKNQKSSKSA